MGHHEAFLDVEDLRVGQDWERRLYEEISRSDALLIVLTGRWLASKWCFAEYTQARAFGKPVLPLICDALKSEDQDLFAPQIQRLPLREDRGRALA